MKLNGTFILRQVADEILAIPVGKTALRFHGMVLLNGVSRVIWEQLTEQTDLQTIVAAVTERFEVPEEQAREDILEFLQGLKTAGLLEE